LGACGPPEQPPTATVDSHGFDKTLCDLAFAQERHEPVADEALRAARVVGHDPLRVERVNSRPVGVQVGRQRRVQQRQLPAVKLLLAKGADADKRDTAAGYSAREYAKRDTRNRELLQAIEVAKTPAAKSKNDDLDSFKLN
jgi:hypothetical protein